MSYYHRSRNGTWEVRCFKWTSLTVLVGRTDTLAVNRIISRCSLLVLKVTDIRYLYFWHFVWWTDRLNWLTESMNGLNRWTVFIPTGVSAYPSHCVQYCMHAHTHARTHTHTQTQTHTLRYIIMVSVCLCVCSCVFVRACVFLGGYCKHKNA